MLIAYLLGTLLGSLILGRLRGVDIRSMGSGNAGATNALRTQGKLFGFLVLVVDIAKGLFAVWWLPSAVLPGVGIDPGSAARLADAGLRLRGDRGACLSRVVRLSRRQGCGDRGRRDRGGGTAPARCRCSSSWFIVLVLTGYVGLATMLSRRRCAGGRRLCARAGQRSVVELLRRGDGFVIYTHRGNIARMRAGRENRVRRLWLFRSRTA